LLGGAALASSSDPFMGALPTVETAAPTARDLGAGASTVGGMRGAATYNYPIAVPPGRKGMHPALSLAYSSSSPVYGGLAVGWTLGGLPSIALDISVGASTTVRYLADGRRLVPTPLDTNLVYKDASGVSHPTTAFRAELDSSQTRYGLYDPGSGGTKVWVAKSPDGRTRTFEKTDGIGWVLTRERDAFGNSITYTWDTTHGFELTRIDYGANAAAGLANFAHVDFSYTSETCTGNSMPIGATIDRGVAHGWRRLLAIESSVQWESTGAWHKVQHYDLAYDAAALSCSAQNAAPARYLSSLSQTAYDRQDQPLALPPINFTYGAKAPDFAKKDSYDGDKFPGRGNFGLSPDGITVMREDVDGDGIPDQLSAMQVEVNAPGSPFHNGKDVKCGLEFRKGVVGGLSSAAPSTWILPTASWRNGHNPTYSERCTVSRQVFRKSTTVGGCPISVDGQVSYQLLDMNADERPDLVVTAWTGLEYKPRLDLEQSPSSPFRSFSPPSSGGPGTDCEPAEPARPEAGISDGYRVRIYRNSGGAFSSWSLSASDGPWYLPPISGEGQLSAETLGTSALPTLVDIDGDGFVDLVRPPIDDANANPPTTMDPAGQAFLKVYRGHGTGFASQPLDWPKPIMTLSGAGGSGWSARPEGNNAVNTTAMSFIDVNGDGLPDLVFHEGNLKVAFNTGHRFAASVDLGITGPVESYFSKVNSWVNGNDGGHDATDGTRAFTRRWLDIDGDHRPDIVDFPRDGETWAPKVYFNLGTRFTGAHQMAALRPARQFYDGSVANGVPANTWRQESDFVDWDADGVPDVVTWSETGASVYRNTFDGVPMRLLASINNGHGQLQRFTYDSSNHAAAQESGGNSRAPTWVVTKFETSPGMGQPWESTSYRYGAPTFRQHADASTSDDDSEPVTFAGFARLRTTGSAPNGAAAGKQTLQKFVVHQEDGSDEPIETDTFANDAAGLVPSSVDTTEWTTYTVLGVATLRLPTKHTIYTCASAQTTVAACVASGAYDRSTFTNDYLSASTGTKLVAVNTSTVRENSADARDTRKVENAFELRYVATTFPADDYRLQVKSERHYRNVSSGGTPSFTLSSQQDVDFFVSNGLPDKTKVWLDSSGTVAVTSKVWAATGNLLSVTRPSQQNEGTPKKLVYTYSGHQIAPAITTNEVGQQSFDTVDEGNGKLLSRSGPNGKMWQNALILQKDEYSYDGLGRTISHYRSFDDDTAGYVQVLVEFDSYYDIVNTIRETHRLDLEGGVFARFTATTTVTDGSGRPVQVTDFRGTPDAVDAVTRYKYDAAGMLAREVVPDPRTDSGVTVAYELTRDSLGRPTKLARPDGTSVNVTYDGLAKTISAGTSDGSGGTKRTVSDPFGRLIELHELDNPTPGADAFTRYYYDDGDRLSEVDDAEGGVTTLGYDLRGARTSLDRDGRHWSWTYDLDGNLFHEVFPKPTAATPDADYTSTNHYDPLGRITSHEPARRGLVDGDRLGVGTTVYEYDAAPNGRGAISRVRQERAAGDTGLDFLRVEYEYAAQGGVSLETRSFNASPAPAAGEGFTAVQSVTRQLDARGATLRETWDNGQTVFTNYDVRGMPHLVEYAPSAGGARQTLANYGDRGVDGRVRRRTTGTFFGGQARDFTYDVLGRELSDAVTVGPATRLSRSYTYYDAGNVHTIDGANYDAAGAVFANAGAVFTYDAQDRLKIAFGPGAGYSAAMTYTATGNVASAGITGPASVSPRNVTYNYGATDAQAVDTLQNVGDGSAFAHFTYDVAGQTLTRELAVGVPMNLSWTGDGQLLKVDGPGAAKIETYHYDANGARAWAVNAADGLRFWFGASETRFMNGVVQERSIHVADDSGEIARVLKRGTAAPSVEISYADGMHSLMLALGEHGEVMASFVYGAFGEVVAQLGESSHRRQFNGKENDAASGLRDYGARSYDPVSLRWLSADPLHLVVPEVGVGNPQSQNLYTFSNNNPVRYYDPDGRQAIAKAESNTGAPHQDQSTCTAFEDNQSISTSGGMTTVDADDQQSHADPDSSPMTPPGTAGTDAPGNESAAPKEESRGAPASDRGTTDGGTDAVEEKESCAAIIGISGVKGVGSHAGIKLAEGITYVAGAHIAHEVLGPAGWLWTSIEIIRTLDELDKAGCFKTDPHAPKYGDGRDNMKNHGDYVPDYPDPPWTKY
jgi:RHS repeat-associated protein